MHLEEASDPSAVDYRRLLIQQTAAASTAALQAGWLARRLHTRGDRLLCEAAAAGQTIRGRRLAAEGNRLLRRAERLEQLAGYHRSASQTADAALTCEQETPAAAADDIEPPR